MDARFTIVGIGESLFDVFPGNHYRLGGAPLNLAIHAHQLADPHGGRGVIVTRVGQDALGKDLRQQVRERGMTTQYIQSDPDRPTGRANVTRGPQGELAYQLTPNTAYDMLWFEAEDEDLARQTDAVCFGSLAQRDAQARNAIRRFLDCCGPSTVKLFDVNLRRSRGQAFYDQRTIQRSCEAASLVKCNEDELPELAGMLGVDPEPSAVVRACGLDGFVLTRGQQGTAIHTRDGVFEGEPASYPPAEDADAVGAGDAASAAVLAARVLGRDPQATADLANHVGAYVAAQPGATPPLPEEILQRVALQ